MKHLEPYIEAHHEAVYRSRTNGRLHDIRASWWALMGAFREYEPRANIPAALALMGCGAVLGVIAGILIGLAR